MKWKRRGTLIQYSINASGKVVPTTRMRGVPDADRFKAVGWDVTGSGCWEWRGSRSPKGYGKFIWSGGQLAHRFALEQSIGRPIADGMSAMHSCDNRPCVNPEHLSEGTHKENMAQAAIRCRFPQAKLTPNQVLEIFSLLESDGDASIANRFGVTRKAIRNIRNGRNWAWLRDREE